MTTRIPALSAKEMAELDRRLFEEYQIDLLTLMENAGRSLAYQAREMLGPVHGRRILIMAGRGNNGGGGMVGARHLHNWGAIVDVVLSSREEELRGVPSLQFGILRRMNVGLVRVNAMRAKEYDLIIDALLGYNQKGDPRGNMADLVRSANASGKPVLCLDIPTGLDPDSGRPNDPCIKGTRTLTLALPKKGLLEARAGPYLGDLYLADIGVPMSIYRELGIKDSIFGTNSIIRISP